MNRIYTRRWTTLSWWHSVKMFKKFNMISQPDDYHIFHMFPPHFDTVEGRVSIKEFKSDSDKRLLDRLLSKYPEFRYVPGSKGLSSDAPIERYSGFLHTFIIKQKQYIKKGFTEEKAFEMTEKMYQDRMQRKKNDNLLTRSIGMNNRGRSFLTFYEQQAEYESRLKVLRMERDLSKYEEAKKEFKKKMDEMEDPESQMTLSDMVSAEPLDKYFLKELQEELEKNETNQPYSKVFEKIVSRVGENDKKRVEEDKQAKIDEFIKNTKSMFAQYYERAAMKDRLSGLKDEELKATLKESPKRFKIRSKLLRKKLEKYNIKLNEEGNVDFSNTTAPPNLVKKLQNNPLVQMALLSQDLGFEFEHAEKKMEETLNLKIKLQKIEETQNDEEYMEKFVIRPGEENIYKRKHIKSEHKTYNKIHDEADEMEEESAREVEKKAKAEELLNDPNFIHEEDSYRLIETYPERLKRLEKKWLNKKIKENEGDSISTKIDLSDLQETISDLRRLKFLMEQSAYSKAQNLLFEEHSVFDEEELLVDNEVPLEKLGIYLNKSIKEKKMTVKEELDEKMIFQMIERREWNENSVRPFNFSDQPKFSSFSPTDDISLIRSKQAEAQSLADSTAGIEFAKGNLGGGSLEEESEKNAKNTLAMSNMDGFDDKVQETEETKEEKKKLLEFIRTTTEKKEKKIRMRKEREPLSSQLERVFGKDESCPIRMAEERRKENPEEEGKKGEK